MIVNMEASTLHAPLITIVGVCYACLFSKHVVRLLIFSSEPYSTVCSKDFQKQMWYACFMWLLTIVFLENGLTNRTNTVILRAALVLFCVWIFVFIVLVFVFRYRDELCFSRDPDDMSEFADIESVSSVSIRPLHAFTIVQQGPSKGTCSICLEDLFNKRVSLMMERSVEESIEESVVIIDHKFTEAVETVETVQPREVVRLDCDHLFHKACIEHWCVRKPTCPLCRRSLYQSSNRMISLT